MNFLIYDFYSFIIKRCKTRHIIFNFFLLWAQNMNIDFRMTDVASPHKFEHEIICETHIKWRSVYFTLLKFRAYFFLEITFLITFILKPICHRYRIYKNTISQHKCKVIRITYLFNLKPKVKARMIISFHNIWKYYLSLNKYDFLNTT